MSYICLLKKHVFTHRGFMMQVQTTRFDLRRNIWLYYALDPHHNTFVLVPLVSLYFVHVLLQDVKRLLPTRGRLLWWDVCNLVQVVCPVGEPYDPSIPRRIQGFDVHWGSVLDFEVRPICVAFACVHFSPVVECELVQGVCPLTAGIGSFNLTLRRSKQKKWGRIEIRNYYDNLKCSWNGVSCVTVRCQEHLRTHFLRPCFLVLFTPTYHLTSSSHIAAVWIFSLLCSPPTPHLNIPLSSLPPSRAIFQW